MIIITACNKNYWEYAKRLQKRAKDLGYQCLIYDLDKIHYPDNLPKGLRIGKRTYEPKSQWKPYLIRKSLKTYKDDIVWLDADTQIIKPLDIDWNFKVAVTLRRDKARFSSDVGPFAHISGYLNAGVIFFRKDSIEFADEWIKEMSNTTSGSDQEGLNRMVFNYNDTMEIGKEYHGIKILSNEEYNFNYLNEPIPETTKIVHCIGGFRKLHKDF